MANEIESISYIKLNDGQNHPIDAMSVGGKTKEQIGDLVTTINSESTDTQYPSAKCMWTIYGQLEDRLKAI